MFGINGRFLTQPATGVQRYAFNVTSAISERFRSGGRAASLLAPPGTVEPPFDPIRLQVLGRLRGHAWEQLELARAWPGDLLNLCNTAPVLKRNQVVCIHDANAFIVPDSYSRSFRLLYKTLQPILARRAARIATVSRFSATQLSKYLSVKASDIVVLPNGHEHVAGWDAARAGGARLALGQTDAQAARPFVLALASRARHKNLNFLLDLAPELERLNVRLVIAGGSSDIFTAEALQKSDNVQHLGFVTDDDLAFLFEHALCLLFPSLTEGFGLPVLEAMALGCPVVSTDRASLPEICGSAALLAPPDQPALWLGHIRSLLESENLRADLSGYGREQAKLFSWSETAAGYIALMERLA